MSFYLALLENIMNPFERIKHHIPLMDVIPYYTSCELVECGSQTLEPEDKTCPFCGHKDCFKVKDEGEASFYNCFSCGEKGDAINFVSKMYDLEPMDAVEKLSKDFNIPIHKESAPTTSERIMYAAMGYYHEILISPDTKLTAKGKHPMQYQIENRFHDPALLESMKIGFTDGNLHHFLLSTGFSEAELIESGMVAKDTKRGILYDYFTAGLFVYPHFVGNRVSSFSQKDPEGKYDYQFPARFRLNNCLFWGQDTVAKSDKVAIVEGQNDRISVIEAGFDGAVLCTCGQLSGKQLEWIRDNLAGKQVVSFFDSDDAGDTYRSKLKKVLPKATQIRLMCEGIKDIDDFLKKGRKSLIEAFSFVVGNEAKEENGIPELVGGGEQGEMPSVSIPSFDRELGIVEKDGAYFKIRKDKEGDETLMRLTDFTIKLKNIFLLDGKRVREAEIIRWDGFKSNPMLVDSETKVSLKQFRSKVADACDANFFGQEADLMSMWRYVYKHGTEKTVYIPDHIGLVENDGGWLFGNVYLRPNGEIIAPDKSGVMWVGGNTRGIRPQSLSDDLDYDVYAHGSRRIPRLNCELTEEETDSVEATMVRMYAQNLGDPGKACMILGWAKLNAYSNLLFDEYGFTPFLFLWGGNGIGKTSLLQWVLGIYAMKESGYDTLSNLRSGVGFERKLGYYSSLPVCLDELRTGKELTEFTGRFRAWYNRSGRSMAAHGSKKIIQQRIRSNFVFGGQDIFTDDALRERCVVFRITKEGREMSESYRTISRLESQGKLSAIGFKWLMEAQEASKQDVIDGVEAWTTRLMERGCKPRTARVWALIAKFAESLANKFFPDFDFIDYVLNSCETDLASQVDNSFLTRFFELVEGIAYMVNSPITADHLKISKDKLFIWFVDVHRIAASFKRDPTEETFSKEALRSALKEESYFIRESPEKMGVNCTSRRVIVIDLNSPNLPESLKNLGDRAQNL